MRSQYVRIIFTINTIIVNDERKFNLPWVFVTVADFNRHLTYDFKFVRCKKISALNPLEQLNQLELFEIIFLSLRIGDLIKLPSMINYQFWKQFSWVALMFGSTKFND